MLGLRYNPEFEAHHCIDGTQTEAEADDVTESKRGQAGCITVAATMNHPPYIALYNDICVSDCPGTLENIEDDSYFLPKI